MRIAMRVIIVFVVAVLLFLPIMIPENTEIFTYWSLVLTLGAVTYYTFETYLLRRIESQREQRSENQNLLKKDPEFRVESVSISEEAVEMRIGLGLVNTGGTIRDVKVRGYYRSIIVEPNDASGNLASSHKVWATGQYKLLGFSTEKPTFFRMGMSYRHSDELGRQRRRTKGFVVRVVEDGNKKGTVTACYVEDTDNLDDFYEWQMDAFSEDDK